MFLSAQGEIGVWQQCLEETFAEVSSWPVSAWHEARMRRDADGRSWLVENYEQHSESPLDALAPKLHGETFCFFQVSGLTSQYGFSWSEPILCRLGLKEMWVAAAYDDYSVEDVRRVLKERIGAERQRDEILIFRRIFQTDEWVRILRYGTLGPVVPTADRWQACRCP